jgi:hypothetical protein
MRRMTLIAINVLLDPDAATVEKAQAANARLREDYPDGFALDANHAPHITILQRFVRTANLNEVANVVAEALRVEQSMKWESKATGYYDLAYKNLGLVGIVIEPTQDLRRLQQGSSTPSPRSPRRRVQAMPLRAARTGRRSASRRWTT